MFTKLFNVYLANNSNSFFSSQVNLLLLLLFSPFTFLSTSLSFNATHKQSFLLLLYV